MFVAEYLRQLRCLARMARGRTMGTIGATLGQTALARGAQQQGFALGAALPALFDRLGAGRADQGLQAGFALRADAPLGLNRLAARRALGWRCGLGHRRFLILCSNVFKRFHRVEL